MKIFVASSYRNKFHEQIVELLESKGFEVYNYRTTKLEKGNNDDTLKGAALGNWKYEKIRLNLHAISDCDAVLVLEPCEYSTAFETGFAFALKKPIMRFETELTKSELYHVLMCEIIDITAFPWEELEMEIERSKA